MQGREQAPEVSCNLLLSRMWTGQEVVPRVIHTSFTAAPFRVYLIGPITVTGGRNDLRCSAARRQPVKQTPIAHRNADHSSCGYRIPQSARIASIVAMMARLSSSGITGLSVRPARRQFMTCAASN